MDHTRARRVRKKKVLFENTKSISQVLTDFCQNTSGHGFQYWVSASTYFERILWICIVACGFTFASIMVSSALSHWFKNPSSVAIRDPIHMKNIVLKIVLRFVLRCYFDSVTCANFSILFIFLVRGISIQFSI